MFWLVHVHALFCDSVRNYLLADDAFLPVTLPRSDADVSMEGFQAASLVRFISSAVIVLGSFIGDNYINGLTFELFA